MTLFKLVGLMTCGSHSSTLALDAQRMMQYPSTKFEGSNRVQGKARRFSSFMGFTSRAKLNSRFYVKQQKRRTLKLSLTRTIGEVVLGRSRHYVRH